MSTRVCARCFSVIGGGFIFLLFWRGCKYRRGFWCGVGVGGWGEVFFLCVVYSSLCVVFWCEYNSSLAFGLRGPRVCHDIVDVIF